MVTKAIHCPLCNHLNEKTNTPFQRCTNCNKLFEAKMSTLVSSVFLGGYYMYFTREQEILGTKGTEGTEVIPYSRPFDTPTIQDVQLYLMQATKSGIKYQFDELELLHLRISHCFRQNLEEVVRHPQGAIWVTKEAAFKVDWDLESEYKERDLFKGFSVSCRDRHNRALPSSKVLFLPREEAAAIIHCISKGFARIDQCSNTWQEHPW